MAAMHTGGCDPPVELLIYRLCQGFNYTPGELRGLPMTDVLRYLAVLDAEARVGRL
jgi:hypothetical protein